MKQVIVLEAIRPLQGVGKAQKPNLSFAMGAFMAINRIRKIRIPAKKQLFFTGVASGIMALISVCLSMNVISAVCCLISLICFWIEDETKEEGGEE